MEHQSEEIDFVVTWVDGNDPVWRKEKSLYTPKGQDAAKNGCDEIDDREERYRDYGMLRYWFRGVEKFAPWVRTVHFVTYGHLPDWLNVNHPKLHIVRHEEYIPREYLPTYNCNVIEIFLNRIPGLSEKFIYFNDDMYLTRPVEPKDFFAKGKPSDMLAFQPVVANPKNPVMSHLFLNNTLVLSRHFDKRENVRRHPGNYFKVGYPPLYFFYNLLELAFAKYTGFYTVHGPYPFLKGTFDLVWDQEAETLYEMGSHRFRSKDDLTLYLFRDWQKLIGAFTPKNIAKDFSYYELAEDNSPLFSAISRQKKKAICINDANQEIDFERTKEGLEEAFLKVFPEPCSFEIQGME